METYLLFKFKMYEKNGGLNDLVGAYETIEAARDAAGLIKVHGNEFQIARVKDGVCTWADEGYYSETNGMSWTSEYNRAKK